MCRRGGVSPSSWTAVGDRRGIRENAPMEIWPGTAYPLGATFDGAGTNFALFSEVADRVELCLFDSATSGGRRLSETRVDLPEADGFVWHGYLPLVGPGQCYGFGVYGPRDPARGTRCNPSKLLLDPYA